MKPLPCPPEHWSEFSRLLDQAMDLDVAERAHWLDRLPGASAHLRPFLARVLAADALIRTGEYLQQPRLPSAGDTETEFQAGQLVGNHRLVDRLGRGGMGEVWRARRIDGTLDREVALKLPHAGVLAHISVRGRLQRERDILASLKHPHIAQIYDANVTRDGQMFLELELVDGEPIDTHCNARRLGVHARLTLFQQVVDAIRYAHGRLIVHRDLKPSNVFVTKEGEVKLLDFGIAKLLDERGGGDATELTRLVGAGMTPAYAAPEQFDGRPVSVATDVFSLGVILFELLTGQRPFGNTREQEAPLASTRVASGHDTETDGTLREMRRALTGDLDAILACCLSLDPAQRYASVERLSEDLDRHLRHEPIVARHISRTERAWKFVRRNRVAVTMGSALAVALIVGAAGTMWQGMRAARAAQESERSRQDAEELIGFMLGDLQSKLKEVGRLDILDAVGDRAMTYFSRHADTADVSTLRARAQALRQIGEIRQFQGKSTEALRAQDESLAVRRQLSAAHPDDLSLLADVSDGYSAAGYAASYLGNLDAAVTYYATELEIAKQLVAREPDNPKWLELLAIAEGDVAYGERGRGRYAEGLPHALASVEADRRLVQRFPDDDRYTSGLSQDLNRVIECLEGLNRKEEARVFAAEALSITRALVAKAPDDMQWVKYMLFSLEMSSRLAMTTGHSDEVPALNDAHIAAARKLVARDPDAVIPQNFLGRGLKTRYEVLLGRGDLAQARTVLDERVQIYDKLVRRDPEQVSQRAYYAVVLQDGAELSMLENDFDRAQASITQARALWKDHPPKDAFSERVHFHNTLVAWDVADRASSPKLGTLPQDAHALLATIAETHDPNYQEWLVRVPYLDGDAPTGDAQVRDLLKLKPTSSSFRAFRAAACARIRARGRPPCETITGA